MKSSQLQQQLVNVNPFAALRPGLRWRYLAKVAHDAQVLHVQVVAAVGAHDLGALPRQGGGKVAPQEPSGPKHGGRDATHLHGSDRLCKNAVHIGTCDRSAQKKNGAIDKSDAQEQCQRTEERPPGPARMPVFVSDELMCATSFCAPVAYCLPLPTATEVPATCSGRQ